MKKLLLILGVISSTTLFAASYWNIYDLTSWTTAPCWPTGGMSYCNGSYTSAPLLGTDVTITVMRCSGAIYLNYIDSFPGCSATNNIAIGPATGVYVRNYALNGYDVELVGPSKIIQIDLQSNSSNSDYSSQMMRCLVPLVNVSKDLTSCTFTGSGPIGTVVSVF
jgi:hypothetical protein